MVCGIQGDNLPSIDDQQKPDVELRQFHDGPQGLSKSLGETENCEGGEVGNAKHKTASRGRGK